MKPINFKEADKVFGKDQNQYNNLPAKKFESTMGEVLSCWQMSFKERVRVLVTGKVWLSLWAFNKPIYPARLSVSKEETFKDAEKLAKDNPIAKTTVDVKEILKGSSIEQLQETLKSLRKQAIIVDDEIKRRGHIKIFR